MSKWCIGIDLGGTFIKFIALDADRKATEPFQLPTPDGGKAVLQQMIDGAKSAFDRYGLDRQDVLGVGIGSPGPLKVSEGIIVAMPNVADMENVPIRDRVAEGVGLPAVLENDANAAAFGEYISGAGGPRGDMVLLTLGTGIGSGIILGGRILHGWHELGGEIGHWVVAPGGELCGCGQRGCLERYSSAAAIARLAAREIEQNGRDSLLKARLADRGAIDAKDVNEARLAGDALAGEIWHQAVYYLAVACINICRALDPEEIILAGGLIKAGEDLTQPLEKCFRELNWTLTEPMTKLSLARMGNDAGVLGAAGVAWQAFGDC